MPRRFVSAPLLSGLSPRVFLSRHWQKRPLLARAALTEFADLLTPQALQKLATRDDMLSKVVVREGSTWHSETGPFTSAFFRRLPPRNWTVLVHDINHVLATAQTLLRCFDFISYARLDDLMVSYAAPGGGVGPHFDSYDVFLLQGLGRRRWRVGHQRDLSLRSGIPLKVLRRFSPEHDWSLDSGDMLYVPPGWAHDGVALEPCMTYSIGFRAPTWQELRVQFLRFLEDEVGATGMYADPWLAPTAVPGMIGSRMLAQVGDALAATQWNASDVTRFLGQYLTEPKAHVFFETPEPVMPLARFTRAVRTRGLELDLKTQMLYRGDAFFVNGETVRVRGRARATLAALADRRELAQVDSTQRGVMTLLHEWYAAGFVRLRESRTRSAKEDKTA